MTTREGLHVVLGGSGGVGSAVALLLAQESVSVRAVNRNGKIPHMPRRVHVMAAEAIVPETLHPVCEGAQVIYHCLHPRRDYGLLTHMTRHIIRAAENVGAILVVAGNMWPYGPVDRLLTEDLPFQQTGINGRAYIESANLVAEAVAAGKIRAVVGRVAHCYGPHIRRAWPGTNFDSVLLGEPNHIIGDPDALHTYTYVDDFARGLITLASNDEALGKVWHIPSPPPLSMRQFMTMMYDEMRQEVRYRISGRLGVWLQSLVNQEANRLREMAYQFERPFVVGSSRYESSFGVATTPHSEGIRRTLDWYLHQEKMT